MATEQVAVQFRQQCTVVSSTLYCSSFKNSVSRIEDNGQPFAPPCFFSMSCFVVSFRCF